MICGCERATTIAAIPAFEKINSGGALKEINKASCSFVKNRR